MKMRAAVVQEKNGPYVYEEVELDEPKEDEVLVRIIASGICHSDELARKYVGKFPCILGHEGAGIVVKAGPKVENVKPGDHVVLSVPHCGECDSCKIHDYPYCERRVELVSSGAQKDGTFRLHQNGKDLFAMFAMASFA